MKELVAILVIVSNLLFGNSATQCFEDNPQCWDSRIIGNREQGEFDPCSEIAAQIEPALRQAIA